MRMFELLPRPLGSIFRKLTHLACNSRFGAFCEDHFQAFCEMRRSQNRRTDAMTSGLRRNARPTAWTRRQGRSRTVDFGERLRNPQSRPISISTPVRRASPARAAGPPGNGAGCGTPRRSRPPGGGRTDRRGRVPSWRTSVRGGSPAKAHPPSTRGTPSCGTRRADATSAAEKTEAQTARRSGAARELHDNHSFSFVTAEWDLSTSINSFPTVRCAPLRISPRRKISRRRLEKSEDR